MKTGDTVLNTTKGQRERIGRLLKMHANKREEIKEVYAGDIAAAVGLKHVTTGDTICDSDDPVVLESIQFPAPVIALAVEPKTKSDQEKLGERPRQADAGGPDLQGRDRQGHRPDQDLRHGRAAPRDHRGPPEARVLGRGQRRQAPGGLQGDDPQGGQGRGQVHQADRRPRPVRALQDRALPGARRGLRLRERHHRRLDPEGVHQADRDGDQGGHSSAASWPATRWWT